MTDEPDTGTSREPTCPRHPTVVSYVRCQRCGRPACPDCRVPAPVGVHCIDCLREEREAAKKSKPMRKARAATGRPVVTLTLIVVNVAMFIVGPLLWGTYWYDHLGLYPAHPFDEPWRWVTMAFAHAGFLHIAFNMFALFQFGWIVERLLGRAKFILLYSVSLLGSSAFVAAFGEHNSVVLGASGAIYGLLAAYVIIAWKAHQPMQMILIIGALWLVLPIVYPGMQMSWQGHLGGAVAGSIVTFLMLPRRKPTIARWK